MRKREMNIVEMLRKICTFCVIIVGLTAIIGTSDDKDDVTTDGGVPVSIDSLEGNYTLAGFTYTFYDNEGNEIQVITDAEATEFRGTMIINSDNSVTQTIFLDESTQNNSFTIQSVDSNSADILEDGCSYEIELDIDGSELTITKPYNKCERNLEEVEEWTKIS